MAAQPSLSSLATLDQLENGFFGGTVTVRVLHSWEARNPKKGNNLMGLELLLLDEKVFITAARIGRFESALKPHGIYSIKNFLVTNNRTTYKVSDHKHMIQFTDQTVVEELKQLSCIAREKFRFRSHEDFEAHADANEDLYDALGKIVLVKDEESDLDSAKGRIGIHLHLENGPVVRVTFWTGVAKQFRDARSKLPAAPQVLLATAINPRRLGGVLYLNSTSATRFFFDNDVEPSSKYLTWLNDNKKVGEPADLPASAVTKLELVSITELNTFLTSKSPQQAGFICEAKIVDILPEYGWNYIACTKCTCKLSRSATSLVCRNCNDPNAVGVIRYRVELLVKDNDDKTATFVVFDRDATQLTGQKASDLVAIDDQETTPVAARKRGTVPQCLLDVIGKTFTFQLKVTEYNFTASRQTITVSRILSNNNIGPSSSVAPPNIELGISGSAAEASGDKKLGRELQDKEDIEADIKGKRVKYD